MQEIEEKKCGMQFVKLLEFMTITHFYALKMEAAGSFETCSLCTNIHTVPSHCQTTIKNIYTILGRDIPMEGNTFKDAYKGN
jgi:hypothetical protein